MTRVEFLSLHAQPLALAQMARRITRMEAIQANGPVAVSDTVKSSIAAGSATILCHAVVRGQDAAYTKREAQLGRMRAAHKAAADAYAANYPAACDLIDACQNAVTRAALHAVALDGQSYRAAADALAAAGLGVTDENDLRKRVRRWMDANGITRE